MAQPSKSANREGIDVLHAHHSPALEPENFCERIRQLFPQELIDMVEVFAFEPTRPTKDQTIALNSPSGRTQHKENLNMLQLNRAIRSQRALAYYAGGRFRIVGIESTISWLSSLPPSHRAHLRNVRCCTWDDWVEPQPSWTPQSMFQRPKIGPEPESPTNDRNALSGRRKKTTISFMDRHTDARDEGVHDFKTRFEEQLTLNFGDEFDSRRVVFTDFLKKDACKMLVRSCKLFQQIEDYESTARADLMVSWQWLMTGQKREVVVRR